MILLKKRKHHITSGLMLILPKEILNLHIMEKISNLAPKIQNLVPESILDSENVNNFK